MDRNRGEGTHQPTARKALFLKSAIDYGRAVGVEQFITYMQLLLGFIMAEYIIIAVQFWHAARRAKAQGEAATALGQLVAIFVLCAICGYGTRAVQPALLTAMCLGSPIPAWLIVAFHGALAIASALFILSQRPRVIMEGLMRR